MPTNRKRRPQPRRTEVAELEWNLRYELLHGRPMIYPEHDLDTLTAAWVLHRVALLEEWIAEQPGTRLFAWYFFVGVPKYGERRVIDTRLTAEELNGWRVRGILHTDTIPPLQEPEVVYLHRNKVMSPEECQRAGIL